MGHDPLGWLSGELEALEVRHLRRRLAARHRSRAAILDMDGQRLVNFGSNDYLGLAADRRLVAAVQDAMDDAGWGSGASPLVTGRGELHAKLEAALADFEGTEAALLFPSGFAANLGTIAALTGPGDVIFSDAKNHASIIDGCRLSRADVLVYPHRDVDRLRELLYQAADARRRLIVTDSLFSMDGDLAPLVQLAELAEQFDAMLMVDEAHATGVYGREGRGVCQALGVESGVHVRVGTLSKALGSIGGFVAGCQALIDWLANRARSYVFSTATPEAAAAASLAAIQIVRDEPQRRSVLQERAEQLRRELQRKGWSTGNSHGQIIPVYVGEAKPTMQLAARLRQAGLLTPGIRPPTVPAGESLLRISLCSEHTTAMLDELVAAIGKCPSR